MHDDIGTGTEPETSATLSEQAMMLLARLTSLASASASELEREVLEALQQVESDTLQRASEVCLELAHERGVEIEAFAQECASKLQDLQSGDLHGDPLHSQDFALEESASETVHG